jgi:large subunit ribosomal protein L3
MALGLIGRKLGMTQVYTAAGELVPVTVIQAGPCTVVQAKTVATDGYAACRSASAARSRSAPPRPSRALREGRQGRLSGVARVSPDENAPALAPGDEIGADTLFKEGDVVDVTGHHQGPRLHGGGEAASVSSGLPRQPRHARVLPPWRLDRQPLFSGRVFKNKRMAGQYGNDRVTTQNIEVIAIRAAEHLLLVRGAVPGSRGGVVVVRPAVKAKTHG